MKLAVFGATGGTGRRLITQALAADYDVRALTRSQAKLPPGEQVTAIEGNVLDPETVSETVEHTDAVVCLLGRTPTTHQMSCPGGLRTLSRRWMTGQSADYWC